MIGNRCNGSCGRNSTTHGSRRTACRHTTTPRWQDRLRRTALMPFVAGPGAYLAAGGPLAGWAAVQYACERTLFECLLAMEILEKDSS